MDSLPIKLLVLLALCGLCQNFEIKNNGTHPNLTEIIDLFPDRQQIISFIEELVHPLQDLNKTDCSQDLLHIAEAIFQRKSWAWKYLDSFGKLPSGVEMGNLHWVGSYKECLDVSSTYEIPTTGEKHTFQGKGCNIMVPTSSFVARGKGLFQSPPLTIGFCIPDSCNEKELNGVLALTNVSILQASAVKCQDEASWDWRGTFALCLIGVFVAVIIAATAYDVICVKRLITLSSNSGVPFATLSEQNDGAKSDDIGALNCTEALNTDPPNNGVMADLAKTFSVYTNTLKILNTDSAAEGTLSCIHGIRFLSMTWVILGHTYVFGVTFFADLNNLKTFANDRAFQIVLTAGTYSVDSFFLISGTLVTYLFLRQAKKLGGFKKIPWAQFYVHRFWRLTPPYMLILGVYVCLFPHLSSGPFWNPKGDEVDYCSNWWKNLLYINNLFPLNSTCMGWSWYLANDMQFYIISPLYLIPMTIFPIAGIAVVCVLCLASWVGTGIILGADDIVTSASTGMFTDMVAKNFFQDYYEAPWTRIGPYLIGSLLGYLLYRTSCKLKIPKALLLVGWLLAAAMNLSLVYGILNAHPSEITIKVLYTLGRSAWGLGLAWVILCCCTGNGGIVNHLLSWKALIPLSRLTYCAYLIHPVIIYYCWQSRQHLIESSHNVLVPYFLGFLMISYGFAFVLSLMFEAPMIGLEKIIKKKR